MTKNLVLAGNFNLTNVDELFDALVAIGQHPKEMSDTVTVLERIGHFLDEENERIYAEHKQLGYDKSQISQHIREKMDIARVLERSAKKWDGGYVMAGLLGHGAAFVLRDPSGIRPAFYYENDEVVVVASERPVIQTAFNVKVEDVLELTPGSALIVQSNGSVEEKAILTQNALKKCVFERIYFQEDRTRISIRNVKCWGISWPHKW